jgi:plastocyanin
MSYSFSSKTVTISQGGTVTWNFNSGSHSTTRTGSESWDSGIKSSGTYTRTFNNTGSFGYVCKLHSSMTGTVIDE